MRTVKWFQVLLNRNPNLTSVICLHTVCSIWPIDRTPSGANTQGQGGPRSNGSEGVLYIFQISKAGGLPSDGLMSYLGHSLGGGILPLYRDTVGVFWSPSWLGW